jgi:hypothetical protein
LAAHAKRMTRRSDKSNQPSSFKRRKLTDNATSKTQSLARDRSTAGNAELLRWLDQADKQDGPAFDVFSTVIRKGATSPPGIYKCNLNLNGKDYLKASYIVEPMQKWLSMAKYRKLYVSDLANVSRISLTVNSTIGNQTLSCGDCVFVKPQDASDRDWSMKSELQMNIMSFFAAAGSNTLEIYLKRSAARRRTTADSSWCRVTRWTSSMA